MERLRHIIRDWLGFSNLEVRIIHVKEYIRKPNKILMTIISIVMK